MPLFLRKPVARAAVMGAEVMHVAPEVAVMVFRQRAAIFDSRPLPLAIAVSRSALMGESAAVRVGAFVRPRPADATETVARKCLVWPFCTYEMWATGAVAPSVVARCASREANFVTETDPIAGGGPTVNHCTFCLFDQRRWLRA